MIASSARHLGLSALLLVWCGASDGLGRSTLDVDVFDSDAHQQGVHGVAEVAPYSSSVLDAWLQPVSQPSIDGFWDSCLAARALDVGKARVPTSFDWWSHELTTGKRYRFADPKQFILLRRYAPTGHDRGRPRAFYWASQFDSERFPAGPTLSWRLATPGLAETAPLAMLPRDPDDASEAATTTVAFAPAQDGSSSVTTLGALSAMPPISAPAVKQRKCPVWARPKPVIVTSWGSDYDRLPLFDCDGAMAVDALDRVSALARVMGQKRPSLPLPDQANPPEDWPDEWVEGVRLVHPRLLWILQRIGEAYPKHVVHIMSGYRRDARESSPHRNGRAFDLSVRGVAKEQLFAYCMSLHDVGCGYYPYHPFIHFDVRPLGTPKVYWVDASQPGERSKYVDGWPGVVERGALAGADNE